MLARLAEAAIAALLLGTAGVLARIRRQIQPKHRGFDLLLVGLLLVSFGAVLDCLELQNIPDDHAGLRAVLLFLEYGVGYVAGIAHAAAGLLFWVPALLRYQREVSARLDAEAAVRRTNRELETRREALELTIDLASRLHRTFDVEAIAHETVEALVRLSQPPLVAFYLLDDGGTRLAMVSEHGFSGHERELGTTLPIDGSLAGLALSRRELLVSEDIAGDERLEPRVREALVQRGVQAVMIIPLAFRGEALGTVNLIYQHPRDLDQIGRDTLQAIGQTVALAIANARHVAGLAYQAFHDALTGLPNRAGLHREFPGFIESVCPGDPAALALVDLDRFREINDALGHHVGDELLIQLAGRLAERCGDGAGRVFRLGGDEFAVLLTGVSDGADAGERAHELLAEVKRPYQVRGLALEVGASAGVALYPDDGSDSHELLRCADVALYAAKRAGVGAVCYSRGLDTHTPERLTLMHDLGQAVRESALRLHFQPTVELTTGRVVGFEALARWPHGRLGMVPPADFVPLAETGDVIHPFTFWVVERALTQLREWHRHHPRLTMAVNLSMRNLHDRDCAAKLSEIIRRVGVDASRVEFELTETALMSDPKTALRTLGPITAGGARLSIDDFGTGYSSLAYLTSFPVHTLKIDGSFVREINRDRRSLAIVRSTIDLGRNLGLAVVAEGVEDRDTAVTLAGLGCELAQGFFFAPPAPAEEIADHFGAGEWRVAV